MLKVVHDDRAQRRPARSGGRCSMRSCVTVRGQMLAAALQAEVAAYIEAHADQLDEHGRRLVVRNGYHAEREVATAAGAVPVRAPRVNDKRVDEATGQRARFSSAILPAWARKSPQVAEVLPLLYLHGLSTGDFAPGVGAVPRLGRGPVRGHRHPADRAVARRRRGVRQAVAGRTPTTCTCGSTGSTSRSAWSRTRCACW